MSTSVSEKRTVITSSSSSYDDGDLYKADMYKSNITPRSNVVTRSSPLRHSMGTGGSGGSIITRTVEYGYGTSSGMGLGGGKAASTEVNSVKNTREREKKDMQDLNERFASYIEKVRFLEAQNRKLGNELEELRSKWGKETGHIKSMYEAELAEARKLIDDLSKDKAGLEIKNSSLQEQMADYQRQLDEARKYRQIDREQINKLNQQLADYESEINMLRRQMESLETDRQRDKNTITKLQNDIDKLRVDLNNETLAHLDAENRRQTLEEEIEFMKKVHEQELKELAALAYRDTTAENREFWKSELSQAIRDIQREYDNKVDQIRGDMEGFYNLKIQEFRTGATKQNMEVTHVREENKKLVKQMTDLRGRVADLEARNAQLESQYQDILRELENKESDHMMEVSQYKEEIIKLRAEMEGILTELQTLMDAKLSLELEIAAYRKLLEGEENRVDVMRSRGPVTIVRDPMRPRFGGARKEVEREKALSEKAERKVVEDECKIVDEEQIAPQEAPAAEAELPPGSPDSNTDAASSVTASDNESLDGDKVANIVKDEEAVIPTSYVDVESKVESSVVEEGDGKGDVVDGQEEGGSYLQSVVEDISVKSKVDEVGKENVVEETFEPKSEMKTESTPQDAQDNQSKSAEDIDTTDAEEAVSDKLADTKEPKKCDTTELKTIKTEVTEMKSESVEHMVIGNEIKSEEKTVESKKESFAQIEKEPMSEQIKSKDFELKSEEVSVVESEVPKETDEQPVAQQTKITEMKGDLIEHEVVTLDEKLDEHVEKKLELETIEKAEFKIKQEVVMPPEKLVEPTDKTPEPEATDKAESNSEQDVVLPKESLDEPKDKPKSETIETYVEDKQDDIKEISADRPPEKESETIEENVSEIKLESEVVKSEIESVVKEPTKQSEQVEIKGDERKSEHFEKGVEETKLSSIESQVIETKSENVEKEPEIESKSTEKAEALTSRSIETGSAKTETESSASDVDEAKIESGEKAQETKFESYEEKDEQAQKSDEREIIKTDAVSVSSEIETGAETADIKPDESESKSKNPELLSESVEQESIKPVSETIEKLEAISSQSEKAESQLMTESISIEKASDGAEMDDEKNIEKSKPTASESDVVSADVETTTTTEEKTSVGATEDLTEFGPTMKTTEAEIMLEKTETEEVTKIFDVDTKETHTGKGQDITEQDESATAGKLGEETVTKSEMIADTIQRDNEDNVIEKAKSETKDAGPLQEDAKSVPAAAIGENVSEATMNEDDNKIKQVKDESKAEEMQDDAVKSSEDAYVSASVTNVGGSETESKTVQESEVSETKEVDKTDNSIKELNQSELGGTTTFATESSDKVETPVTKDDTKEYKSQETLQNGLPDDDKTNVKIEEVNEKKDTLPDENGLPDEGKDDSQVSMKMMRGEVSAKTTYQRTSTGPVAICEVSPEGKFICLENTSSGPNRKDVSLDGWKVRRVVDGKRDYIYPFRNFTLKSGKKVKILARGAASEAGLNDLVFRDEDNWGVGSQVNTALINEKDEEKATHVQKTLYN